MAKPSGRSCYGCHTWMDRHSRRCRCSRGSPLRGIQRSASTQSATVPAAQVTRGPSPRMSWQRFVGVWGQSSGRRGWRPCAYPVLGSGADRSCRGRPGRWRVHGRRRSRRACRHRRARAAGGHDRVHTELVAAGHAPARRCLPADRAGRSPIRTRSGSPTSSTPAGTFSDTAQGPRSPSNWVRPTITSPPRMPECSSLSRARRHDPVSYPEVSRA